MDWIEINTLNGAELEVLRLAEFTLCRFIFAEKGSKQQQKT